VSPGAGCYRSVRVEPGAASSHEMTPSAAAMPLPARAEFIAAEARLPGLRCSESHYPAGLRLAEHAHRHACITLVAGGSLLETKGRFARAECAAGTAIVRAAGEAHGNRISPEGALNLEFELEPALAAHAELESLERSVVSHPRVALLAAQVRAELRAELRAADRARALILEGLALELLGLATRARDRAAERHRPPGLARVQQRLDAEHRSALSLGELARQAGIHPVHFSRAFRRWFGTTPGDYLRARRIGWAAERLARDPSLPITEVALAAGFYDHSHFHRAFRARLGLSPRTYRARLARPT